MAGSRSRAAATPDAVAAGPLAAVSPIAAAATNSRRRTAWCASSAEYEMSSLRREHQGGPPSGSVRRGARGEHGARFADGRFRHLRATAGQGGADEQADRRQAEGDDVCGGALYESWNDVVMGMWLLRECAA